MITLAKAIGSEVSAEFMDSPDITLCVYHIYHAACSTTVGCTSVRTWRTEPEYIDTEADEPTVQYLSCNAVADPVKRYFYLAVSQEHAEAIVSPGNVLVYDISDDEPKPLLEETCPFRTCLSIMERQVRFTGGRVGGAGIREQPRTA